MKKLTAHRSIGQSTAEYAVLLAIIATALIAMQVYLKRGIQGRIRDLADQVSSQQYEPGRTESVYTTTQSGMTNQTYKDGVSTTTTSPETILRDGNETVYPEEQE